MAQSVESARKNAHPAARFARLRITAHKRGQAFTITSAQYRALIETGCTYCGWPVDRYGAGLDRIDTTRGYEPDNVQPSCGICNYLRRGYFTVDEMHRIGEVIRAIRLEHQRDGRPELLTDYGPRTGRPKKA
jgi:hypothetical protein